MRCRACASRSNSPIRSPIWVIGKRAATRSRPAFTIAIGGLLAAGLVFLAARGLDYHALIAGDGSDRAWLEQYVAENGLHEHVSLLGSVSSDEVRELMTAGDIFFLPSRWEGIALTIYEAMACGLAIVGAEVGGQRELVTADCGILLPKADEATEVAAYTEQLAALLSDPARCRELGGRARARIAAHFRLDEMGDRLVALFRQAGELKARRSQPSFPQGWALECATQAVELARVNDLLDQGWAETQRARAAVRDHGDQLAKGEATIAELRAYVNELLECKRWLEERCEHAERAATGREQRTQGVRAAIQRPQRYLRWIKEWRKLPQKVSARLQARRDRNAPEGPAS